MENAGLDEAKAEIKIAGEISITSDIQMLLLLLLLLSRFSCVRLCETP